VLLPRGAVGFDELLELLGLGQGHEVAGDKELMVEAAGGVFHLGLVFVGAEQQADGRIVTFGHHLILPVVEVEIHLPGVAVPEGTNFEVDEQVAAENPVVENEVEVVVFVADGDAPLPGLETKAGSEFQEEGLEMIEQGLFQIGLPIMRALGEAGELQNVGVANEVGDLARSFHRLLPGAFEDRCARIGGS